MKKFFEELNAIAKPGKREIIEKDYHLHRVLHEISKDGHLVKRLLFKGGTCLIKAYTGYYRFSEDIDFTWKDASIWEGRSPSKTKNLCSREITTLLEHFRSISDVLGLNFKGDKTDKAQVHISSGGRMALFYLGYNSELLGRPERIKIEVNFVDKVLFPNQHRELKSYVEDVASEKMRFLYTEPWEEYTSEIKLDCYDPKEIFVEKCRAAITRKGYKMRDIIDICYLENKYGYMVADYKEQIIDKTKFILDIYGRYRENMINKEFPEPNILSHEEMDLMIKQPLQGLEENMCHIHQQLRELQQEIKRS